MAITIHKEPVVLQAVYNDLTFVVSSDNASKLNFSFVSELIVDGTAVAKIKYPTNPSGYGILDVSRHLQSFLSDDFNNFPVNQEKFIVRNIRSLIRDTSNTFLKVRISQGFVGLTIGDVVYLRDSSTGLDASGTIRAIPSPNTILLDTLSTPAATIVSNYSLDSTSGTVLTYSSADIGGSNDFSLFDVFLNIESLDYRISYSDPTKTYKEYVVNFAEEYRPVFSFFGNLKDGNRISFLSTTDPSLDFFVGDQIVIRQDVGFTNVSYNGVSTITAITYNNLYAAWQITILKPDAIAAASESGELFLSNFRIKEYIVTYTADAKYAFNGVLSFDNEIDWNHTDYYDSSLNFTKPVNFLTTIPRITIASGSQLAYPLRANSYLQLNAQNVVYNKANSWNYNYLVIEVLEIGNVLKTYYMRKNDGAVSQEPFLTFGLGPKQLNESTQLFQLLATTPPTFVDALQPVIPTNAISYRIYGIGDEDNDTIDSLAGFTILLEQKCSKYEDVQLVFMDKLGSFVPYHFDLVSKNTLDINRTSYTRDIERGQNAANDWKNKRYDRGKTTLDTVVTEQFTCTSNWIKQDISDWLSELATSPEVYWRKEDGSLTAINLTVSSIERKKIINQQLINYTFNFQVAVLNNQQKG
jgi:hypothetical protein